MRVAGGVIALLLGLWSVVGGSCSVLGGGAAGVASSQESVQQMGAEMRKAMEKAGQKMENMEGADALIRGMEQAQASSTGLVVSGIVILLSGILLIVAGILFFVNKGKGLCVIAPVVGIIGEVLFIVTVGFGITAVIKVALLAFTAFAGTKVGKTA